jgi:cytochrome c biogenesis protein CcdA/thiol-disulfide isomerase/thioredoxin
MALLLVVAVLGGVLTGISPCVWPVLPVILAGSAAGTDRRRPYAIVAGVIASFCVVVLVALELLHLLHLPLNLLNDLAPYVLLLLGLSLVVPALGELVERPFARLGAHLPQPTTGGSARPPTESAQIEVPDGGASSTVAVATQTAERTPGVVSGFVLGLALGIVFVPCAGPVLTAITVAATHERYTFDLVVVAIAYGLGIAVPLLLVALAGQAAATRLRPLRRHLPVVRRVAGVVIIVLALVMAVDTTTWLTKLPGTTNLESRVDNSLGVTGSLKRLAGEGNPFKNAATPAAGQLPEYGRAPNFTGITTWIGTPGQRPLSLTELRGKVVLIDFWTYSCINCLRSLPHVEAWYRDYRRDGLVVVGVHSPEFPFEHVVSNVEQAVTRLGVKYPVAVDDNLDTWSAFGNSYWPAEYLIDENGNVRYTDFGEGDYATTEQDIRMLLAARLGPDGRPVVLPTATDVPDRTPTVETTPESYLGYERLANEVGTPVTRDRAEYYRLVPVLPGELSFGGTWAVHQWEATAGSGAQIDLNFQAQDVYLVLGGRGTVRVAVNGSNTPTLHVSGVPDLYTVLAGSQLRSGLLTLRFSPGVQAFDFTFG